MGRTRPAVTESFRSTACSIATLGKTIHFDSVEHRPMLGDGRFHAALIEALTESPGEAAQDAHASGDTVVWGREIAITQRSSPKSEDKWTVGCWEGLAGVKFYTYDSE